MSKAYGVAIVLFGFLMGVGVVANSYAADLKIGTGSGTLGGKKIAIPLTLSVSGKEQISSLVGEIDFNPDVISIADVQKDVCIGKAAASAKKLLEVSQLAPGHVRFVIYAGRKAMASGVIANISVMIKSNTPQGEAGIAFAQVSASDPSAKPVKIKASPGKIIIKGTAKQPYKK